MANQEIKSIILLAYYYQYHFFPPLVLIITTYHAAFHDLQTIDNCFIWKNESICININTRTSWGT